uniref:Zgc:112163 n=1 Tax=Scophthalmus maximus TaxID=52904 RepID=A0A8D3BH15_SCOMX
MCDIFVAAARKCLCVGRKSLSVPQSLDLATQVLAVDLGLKPALLYDSNGSSSSQVQQYLSSVQSSQLVSKSLLTLDLNGNTLILNPVTVRSNLEQVLHDGSVAVIDICSSLEKPAITEPLRGELKSMIHDILLLLRGFEKPKEAEKPLCVREKCDEWNLCTAFGLLLGYPVTYWFDQTHSFENCLSMTPLTVTTAAATLGAGSAGHRCRLYSFSIPDVLLRETQSNLDNWRLRLQERFQQQNVLKDLSVCQTTVTLPSVCL